MRRVLAVAAAALLLAATAAPPDAGAAPGLALTVQPVARTLRLGEDVALLVAVDNPTQDAVPLPELRLASDSLTVRVRGGGIRPATVSRLYGAFAENEEGGLRLETRPTRRRSVPPGGRLTQEIRFPAVAKGRLELVVSLDCGEGVTLASEPLEIEVGEPAAEARLVARVETTAGAFSFELDGAHAFNSVSQFWALARSGFYAELPLHRILPGVLVQTGDPRGDGTGTAGWYLPSEAQEEPLARGAVALARGAHEDSGSCQWFVTLADAETAAARLSGTCTRLGTVIEGIEVLDALKPGADANGARPRVLRVRTTVR